MTTPHDAALHRRQRGRTRATVAAWRVPDARRSILSEQEVRQGMSDLRNKERTGRWGKYWYISAIDRDGFDIHGQGGIVAWRSTWELAWTECQKRNERDEGDLQHVPDCPCCGSEMYWHQEWENRSWWQCKGCGHVEWMPCETTTDDTPPGSE